MLNKKYDSSSEKEILDFWTNKNIFQKSIENNKYNQSFIFYDGPPFATGLPHYGHILSGTIKDTIGRWATINGFHVPRRAGWDTHGLPIEYEIEKKYGIKTKDEILKLGINNYNEACRDIVMTYANEWKSIMGRLGRWIDFDNDYKTMDTDFMSKVWNVFSRIYKKDLIYEGVKIMPYSIACTTPLSNFEASSNYQNVLDKTIIVKFKIENGRNEYILSWTTTPWTLPAHYCLCINKNIKYCAYEYNNEIYYFAKSRLDFLKTKMKTHKFNVIKEYIDAECLIGTKYIPPYNFVNKNEYVVVADNFVTDESGTGIVHIAPAFGEDDYRVCIENKLITKELSSLFMHINDNGIGINCGIFSNEPILKMSKMIIKDLEKTNNLAIAFDYEHSYPFCWRSDTRLIYKAVKCWFLKVESIKDQMVEINKTINWVPEHVGKTRFNNWLENTRDWCVSRNRYWGTPIPIWRSDDGDIIVIESKEHLEELTGIKLLDLHRHNIDHLVINMNGKVYKRDETVLDCWFESGSVPFASPVVGYPADFIAEGIDQTRGWFYTLLVIGTILEGRSPYKNVIVNGLVLASDGKKMSKRLKNYPDPIDIVNQYNSDALRYYLIMSPASMGEELRFKNEDVKEIPQRIIIPLTNSLAFFQEYHTLFIKTREFIEIDSDRPFDKWILKVTHDFIIEYTNSLNAYKINPINNILVKYINNLNNNYIRLNRNTLKGKEEDDNDGIEWQKALSTLKKVLNILSIYLSPILPFFCEHVYQVIGNKICESVHLEYINNINISQFNVIDNDIKMINSMLDVVEMIRSIRNKYDIQLKKPLKEIIIYGEDDNIKLLQEVNKYILNEGNIIDITWKKWESTKYQYKYSINKKAVGTLFKSKMKDFEIFMSTISQDDLENIYNGSLIEYISPDIRFFSNVLVGSELVTVHQILPIDQDDGFKMEENIYNKLKIKINIQMDENTLELFIAKNIATMFQKLRKDGGFHVYDNLRLIIKENKFKNIILKHMDYIVKTTRTQIDIVNEELKTYNFHKCVEINDEICDMYLEKY